MEKAIKPTKSIKSVKSVKSEAKTEPKQEVAGLSLSLIGMTGKEVGSMQLPKELFGGKVNDALMQQYVHI